MLQRVVSINPDFADAAYYALPASGRRDAAPMRRIGCATLGNDRVPRQRIEQEGFFANLRASADWIP
jgi:hypothetical protein